MAAALTSLCACGGAQTQLLAPVKFGELIETAHNLTLLDVRTPEEYGEGHIPGAINIDWTGDGFAEKVKSEVQTGDKLAIYCRSGRRSAEAANNLTNDGYRVADLDGGVLAW